MALFKKDRPITLADPGALFPPMPDSAYARAVRAVAVAQDYAGAVRDAHVDAARRRHDAVVAASKAAKARNATGFAEAIRSGGDVAAELARLDLEARLAAEVIDRLGMERLASESSDERYLAWLAENQRITAELAQIGAITVSEDGLANARAQQRALNELAAQVEAAQLVEAEHTSA